MEKLRMIFGFVLLVLLVGLAGTIALGKVEKDTSYGLEYILGALSVLAGGFSQWAFTPRDSKKDENVQP